MASSANEETLASLADKNYVTLETLAGILGVTYRTARKYVLPTKDEQGNEVPARIKSIRVGNQFRIYEEEVRRVLEFGTAAQSKPGA